jgi:D-alanyl-D-alanine dipeptidase
VAALPVIEDIEALEFENRTSPDTRGLLPAMARALETFQHLVMSAGGSVEIKSAYRPEAYQAHLQAVWYKWKQLRYNRQPGCQALRAEVTEEFSRHNLLPAQKPVTSSDHTRGLAFDAAVFMPRTAVKKKRGVSVDRLCRQAGIQRPDVRHDPVHFKLGAAAPVARRRA